MNQPSEPARLVIPSAIAAALLEHARRAAPEEACGLLGGRRSEGRVTAFHPARNELASPYRYSVDPADLVRILLGLESAGHDLVGVFHSHVGAPAVPSASDVREARYPDALHVIASLLNPAARPGEALRAWRLRAGDVGEVPLLIG
jgi:[CysO sulfur-carrier protein]-S-L-cysteine hydrolase